MCNLNFQEVVREIERTNYARYDCAGYDDLIIAFSPFGMPEGKFSMSNALRDSGYDVLFLNCENNLFYLNGVKGLGNSCDETVAKLSVIVERYQASGRVIALGSSMGANGAIHYGSLLGVDCVIAFGFKADIENLSYTFKNNPAKNSVESVPMYTQLIKQSRSEFYLFSGDNEVTDFISLCLVGDKSNVTRLLFSGMDHYLMTYIDRAYGVRAFVQKLLAGDLTIQEEAYAPTLSQAIANKLRMSFVERKLVHNVAADVAKLLPKRERAAGYAALARIDNTGNSILYMERSLEANVLPVMLIQQYRMQGQSGQRIDISEITPYVNESYVSDYIEKGVGA